MERDHWKRHQADARYRQLFQVATDAMMVVDALTMTIFDANRAGARLLAATTRCCWCAHGPLMCGPCRPTPAPDWPILSNTLPTPW